MDRLVALAGLEPLQRHPHERENGSGILAAGVTDNPRDIVLAVKGAHFRSTSLDGGLETKSVEDRVRFIGCGCSRLFRGHSLDRAAAEVVLDPLVFRRKFEAKCFFQDIRRECDVGVGLGKLSANHRAAFPELSIAARPIDVAELGEVFFPRFGTLAQECATEPPNRVEPDAVNVDEIAAEFASGERAFGDLLPLRELLRDFHPKPRGQFEEFIERQSFLVGEQIAHCGVDGGKREEFARTRGQCGAVHFDEPLERRTFESELLGNLAAFVAVVEEDVDRAARADGVTVEVREHLLATLQSDIEEKDHGDGFIANIWAFLQRRRDGCATMLPVIDDESRGHRDMKKSCPKRTRLNGLMSRAEFLESNLSVHGGRDGGENVTVAIVRDVADHRGNAGLVQRTLVPKLRGNLAFLVEREDFGQESKWYHRDVKLPPGLDAADGGKCVFEAVAHVCLLVGLIVVLALGRKYVFFSTNNFKNMQTPVYFDCNATTPMEPEVRESMRPYWEDEFGNEGSRTHSYGARAKQAVNAARDRIAAVVAARREEIVFTSGATESNNLAILGLAPAGIAAGRRHILTTQIEHKAVIEPMEELARRGFDVEFLPPNSDGWVEPATFAKALRPETWLVSLMHANNETGVIQPLDEIADLLKDHPAWLHTDAAQTFGKILPSLRNPRVDLISISGHKIYGPKGVGALVVRRRGYEKPPLTPLFFGGGQERGLRPGTLPVPLIVGLGKAAELAISEHDERSAACMKIRDGLVSAFAKLPHSLNGDHAKTLPHVLNLSFTGADSEALMVALKNTVAISNGSACTSSSYKPSHVLAAMGIDEKRVREATRWSWCHLTPEVSLHELRHAIAAIQSPG